MWGDLSFVCVLGGVSCMYERRNGGDANVTSHIMHRCNCLLYVRDNRLLGALSYDRSSGLQEKKSRAAYAQRTDVRHEYKQEHTRS